jgi:ribosome-dependent ATPase
MDAARVLAIGTPVELTKARNSANLEDAFISYLEEAISTRRAAGDEAAAAVAKSLRLAEITAGRQQIGFPGSAGAACSPI